MRRTRVAALVAAAALLAGCTAPTPDATPAPTPTPTPTPVLRGETRLPDATTVLPDATEAELALAASETFFASSPVVVLAAPDAVARLRAASVAVALGAPLLVEAPVTAEVRRLDAVAVLTVGDVDPEVLADLPSDVDVVAAPDDDAALAELLARRLRPAVADPAEEVAAVARLDRDAPRLLAHDPELLPEAAAPDAGTADPGADDPATDDPSTDDPATDDPGTDVERTATRIDVRLVPAKGRPSPPETDAEAPTEAPTDDPAEPTDEPTALPLTEVPERPGDGLVLTTGAPEELAAVATARAAGLDVVVVPSGDPRVRSADVQAVAAAWTDATTVVGLGSGFGTAEDLAWKAATAGTGVELPGGGQVLFPGRRFVALYGSPDIPALGVLGEQDVTASIERARGLAAEYQSLTADVVVPAFEIIVTIADRPPGEDGNYSNELPVERFVPWVEAALDAGVYVVLDLQPGRTDFLTQAQRYEPLLRYPNVGLALDPEWRLAPDQVHLRQIGSVHVDEVNAVVAWLGDLTRTHHLPQKLLVLHQFMQRMIVGREAVVTTDPAVQVLVHADGQGSQGAKAGTWANLQQNAPSGVVWGWKNFLDEDVPMATPEQTYQVSPTPVFVSYQ
jgi:hypothetical protein